MRRACLLLATALLALSVSASAEAASPYSSATQFGSGLAAPQGVALGPTGDVYVADTDNSRIHRYSSAGALVASYGGPGSGAGQFDHPRGVAVDSAGRIYVADTGNNRVQKLDANGAFVQNIGAGAGSGPGQLLQPGDLAVDPAGSAAIVLDTGNGRAQVFSTSGDFVREFGGAGSPAGPLNQPLGLAYNGYVYIADTGNNRVVKFDSSGAYVAQWGSVGSGSGQFMAPGGIGTDATGTVLVADTGNDRIQRFSGTGTFFDGFGQAGSGAGDVDDPSGVVVDSSNAAYVADSGNDRIQKFAATSNVVITLDTRPDNFQNFQFTTSGGLNPATFQLDDDGFGGGNTIKVPAAAGSYGVSPTIPTGWELAGATCSDGSSTSTIDVSAGETVTCTFTIGKLGRLVIDQDAQPDDTAQSFSFSAGGGLSPSSFSLPDAGRQVYSSITEGSYSVTQTTPAGWDPAQVTCSDGSSPGSIFVSYGETVFCTFVNHRSDTGFVTFTLDRQPNNSDNVQFRLSGGTYPTTTFSLREPTDGQTPTSRTFELPSGATYSLVRTSVDFRPWDTFYTCDDGSPIDAIDVAPDEHINCTLLEKQEPYITVKVVTDPPQQPSFQHRFDYTISGGPTPHSFTQGPSDLLIPRYVRPGTYSVVQAPDPDYDLVSATCDNGEPVSNVTPDYGDEQIVCTFVNQLKNPAHLTIKLDAIPNGPTRFLFRMDGGPTTVPAVLLDDDGIEGNDHNSSRTLPVEPGSGYNLFLHMRDPGNWSQVSATCSDGSSPSSITFSANEDVTCTFRYALAPSITAVVDAQPNDGQDFSFTAGGGLSPSSFSLDDDGDESNALARSRTFSGLAPGSGYSLAQSLPPFWAQQSATCSDGSSPSSIDLGATENVVCTFVDVSSYPGYARPKGGTPIVASLVPAYRPCTSPNRAHGGPLAFGSCNPPQLVSDQLTIDTPDSNGGPAASVSSVKLSRETGDLRITAHVDDVLRADLTDYTGELEARFSFKLTDRGSEPLPTNATTQEFGLSVAVPCVATPDTTPPGGPRVGAACDLSTTLNTLLPGAVVDGRRAMFEAAPVEVYDGGPDSDADTTAGNTVFMRQGIFVP